VTATSIVCRFRVLSLDGGGAKGIYTLKVLKEVEALLNQPVREGLANGIRNAMVFAVEELNCACPHSSNKLFDRNRYPFVAMFDDPSCNAVLGSGGCLRASIPRCLV
jgi:hypothetical protein